MLVEGIMHKVWSLMIPEQVCSDQEPSSLITDLSTRTVRSAALRSAQIEATCSCSGGGLNIGQHFLKCSCSVFVLLQPSSLCENNSGSPRRSSLLHQLETLR